MTSPSLPSQHDNSWTAHTRATLKIGLPLIAAQLLQQAINATDTIMLGWLSAEALAAGVLAATLFYMSFIVASGFAQAVMPLAASAEGEDDIAGVRRATRMGFWVVFAAVTVMLPLMWNAAVVLRALGQQPDLALLAQDYLRIAGFALYPATGVMVLRSYLSALERTQIVMWATLAGVLINIGLNWVLIFGNLGAPAMGMRGAGLATLGTHTLTLVVVAVYAMRHPALARYQIFVRLHRPDWSAMWEVARLGLPVSALLLAEVSLFNASSLMMGWLGTVPLAAHGIALQVISVLFMIPYGLSNAATARVGRALGRRDPVGIDRAARTVLVLGTGFALLSASILWLLPEPLIRLFLSRDEPAAPQILATGAVLLAVAAVFQLVDTWQVVSAAALRGLKDTRQPMIIAVLSYWVLGMPAAYILAFPLGLGGLGVWSGMALGLSMAGIAMTYRFTRRDALGLTGPARATTPG